MGSEEVRRRLRRIEEVMGKVPLVTETLAGREDLFLPYTDLNQSVFYRPKHLDRKTVELAAISSAASLGSEHCLDVHIEQARALGATRDEVMEAMMVGSMMAMTRSQAVAFRRLWDDEPVSEP
ncbi:MAG: carboxymuconolactone decarboxylase family protein [Methanomassiliicoccales archaeon]